MEAFRFQVLTLLILLHRSKSAEDPTELIRTVGDSVTFRIQNPTGKSAFWNFEKVPMVTVQFGDPPVTVFSGEKYERRVSVSENGIALTLSQLSMEDAGEYSVSNNEATSTFILQVYRELAEPTVTCESQNCSAGNCSFSLLCSSAGIGVGNVTYTWNLGNLAWAEGPRVWVEKSSTPLTCRARNAVSSRNVTVTSPEKHCTEARSGSRVGIWVVIGIGVAVLLILFLLFFWKSKGWQKFHFSKSGSTYTDPGAEYTTVYAQVGPSPQCIPNAIPNGIAAKPAQPQDEDSSKTIYSLVKRPAGVDGGRMENVQSTVLELV